MTFRKSSVLAEGPRTVEEQLAAMRSGYKVDLRIKIGGLEIPVRLMPADEEASVIANAKLQVKVPEKVDSRLQTASAIMKAILVAAANVDGTPYLSQKFLKELSHQELNSFYDQYVTLCDSVNPEFEALSNEKIAEMIVAVKKKEKAANDFFTSDLAAIGRYFLAQIQAQDNAPGL